MFLKKTFEQNRALVEFAFKAHRDGLILPDTYLIDLDALLQNARQFLESASTKGLRAYYMLKQAGRNPYIARQLEVLGYDGAVCVDFFETLSYIDRGIRLGNVGHLVQLPRHAIEQVLRARPEIITIYSVEIAQAISMVASDLGITQNIMVKVLGKDSASYDGQLGGFQLEDLEGSARQMMAFPNIKISGVCSFPCFLFDDETQRIKPTPNTQTVRDAANLLRSLGCEITQLNMPSANCLASLDLAVAEGATHVEPGHALLGTTPYHALPAVADEKPAIVYVSEISHNYESHGYCYGGGYYRRSHLRRAMVGTSLDNAKEVSVEPPLDENIDYYLELSEPCAVFDTAVMAFRTQLFVTRSRVGLVEGLGSGHPKLHSVYTSLGIKV
mgnify:CR=1 FL=1